MTTPRQLPRFIPTLTEVVEPTSLKTGVACQKTEFQDLVQQLQRQIQPDLERRLQEEFDQLQQSLLGQHWQAMQLRLQRDMQQMVQQAVADYLGQTVTPGGENSVS